LNKVIDKIFEDEKIREKFEESNEYIDGKLRKYKETFDKLIKEQKSLKKVLEEGENSLSDFIFNIFQEVLGEKVAYRKEDIKDILYSKSVNLLNSIILNFQADNNAKGERALEKARQKLKLSEDEDKEHICSFCGQKGAFSIARDRFFFAPSHLNAFWENNPSIYACPYCSVCSLAIFEALTFLNNNRNDNDRNDNDINAIVVYKPNLKDLEELNDDLKEKFEKNNKSEDNVFRDVVKTIIEYEKIKLKKKNSIREEVQIIEFNLNRENPNVEFYILTEKIIDNIIAIEDQLKNLYENNKENLYGLVKKGGAKKGKAKYYKIDLLKELIKYISQNQKLIYLVQRYSRLGIIAEISRQKEDKAPLVKGFHIDVLLEILKMHFMLEDINMSYDEASKEHEQSLIRYEAAKKYGQSLRERIREKLLKIDAETQQNSLDPSNTGVEDSSKTVGGKTQQNSLDSNTFKNRVIQLSNSFLDASKGSFQQFMETLTRVMISYDAFIDNNLLNILDKTTYREIATTIALALLVEKYKTDKTKKVDKSSENKL